MCALYAAGHTLQVVADKYGLSRQRVSQVLHDSGELGRTRYAQKYNCHKCGVQFTEGSGGNVYRGDGGCLTTCDECMRKKKMMWSPVYELDVCIECGKSDRRHISMGLCSICYSKKRNATAEAKKYRKEYYQKKNVKERLNKYHRTEKYRAYQRKYQNARYDTKKYEQEKTDNSV